MTNISSFTAPPSVEEPFSVSQDSSLSGSFSTNGAIAAARLQSSPSNISTSPGIDTAMTSPSSSAVLSSQPQRVDTLSSSETTKSGLFPRLETNFNYQEPLAPASASTGGGEGSNGSIIPSPMSIEAPGLVQGSKRTASGTVKGGGSGTITSPRPARTGGHSRNLSLESSSARSELAAQLKTRLSYAMLKVQHGWERQSLDELEERTSQVGSPVALRHDEALRHSDSPQSLSRRRRLSVFSENSDRLMFSPLDESSPRGISRSLNATPSHNTYGLQSSTGSSHRALMALSTAGVSQHYSNGHEHGLAPAAHITSQRRPRRSNSVNAPPSLLSTHHAGKSHSDLGPLSNPPRTPRQGILRMPSQQAEKDAVDTLLFMSSPNNSARLVHTAQHSSQGTNLRTESGPKKVAFEARDDSSNSSGSRNSSQTELRAALHKSALHERHGGQGEFQSLIQRS